MVKRKRRRMTERDVQMIVEEIEAWGRGERGKKLTWVVLERIFPFTRQTMYSKLEIKELYGKAIIALKAGYKKEMAKNSGSNDLVVQKLRERIRELEELNDALQKQ